MRIAEPTRFLVRGLTALATSLLLAGCWWDGKDTPTPPGNGTPTYTVGGTVSGLNGSLTLMNNGGDARTVTTNGSFVFATALSNGTAYSVALGSQPANQTCVVTNGSGSIIAANVTNIAVTCTQLYTVGGTVAGLNGTLTLANNGGNALSVTTNGTFAFSTPLANAAAYAVTITTQPANQQCTLANASGAIAAANVTNVSVTCDTTSASQVIGPSGGTLTGPDGIQVVVPAGSLDANTTIRIAKDSTGAPSPLPDVFATPNAIYAITPHDIQFNKPVLVRFPVEQGTNSATLLISSFDLGWNYEPAYINNGYAEVERNTFSFFTLVGVCVTVTADPHPCAIPSGRASIAATPGGSLSFISGLSALSPAPPFGSGVGSAGTWAVNSSTTTQLHFTMQFSSVSDCTNGNVTLKRLPSLQPSVLIATQAASTNSNGRGVVTLSLTPAQLGVSSNGINTFSYSYHCTRPGYRPGSNGYTSGGADFISLVFQPTLPPGFTIGGSINGLGAATGLVLRNGVRDRLAIAPNSTSFTFGTTEPSGMAYNVSIDAQPTNGSCALQNGAGTVTADVTNIVLNCTYTPPSGGLAFVANSTSNTLSIYRRDSANGSLFPLGTTNAGSNPFSVAVSPDNKYVYVSSLVGNGVLAYSIDKTAGTLTAIAGGSRATTNPFGIGMDPLGRFVWATNYSAHTVSAFPIDSNTGALLATSGSFATALFPYAIAVHPSGGYVYVINEVGSSSSGGSISMFSVNGATGALTSIGTLTSVANSGHSIGVTPNAKFAYVINSSNIGRFSINATTGVLTSTGYTNYTGSNSNASANALAIHPNSTFLFAANQSSVNVFAIDSATGALTATGGSPIATGSGTAGISIDSTGEYLYVVNSIAKTVATYSFDNNTGSLTFVGSVSTGNSPQSVATIP